VCSALAVAHTQTAASQFDHSPVHLNENVMAADYIVENSRRPGSAQYLLTISFPATISTSVDSARRSITHRTLS
jgi:hypothetical protein